MLRIGVINFWLYGMSDGLVDMSLSDGHVTNSDAEYVGGYGGGHDWRRRRHVRRVYTPRTSLA